MHPELVSRFNNRVRDEAASRFGAAPDDLSRLNAFENHIFEFTNPDGLELILRISHSARRTHEYTQGEIEFVRFLSAAGLPVASPVLSDGGQFIERIEDKEPGQYFVAVAFERAAGVVFDEAPALKDIYWTPTLFRELGQIFARLHNRAQEYRLSSPRYKRQEWHEYDVVDIDRFAPPDETLVRERTAAIIERLRRLPRGADDYGLIHADLHMHNFCFDAGRITVFDFDNAEYAWFAKDIAVVLFYVARTAPRESRATVAAEFLGPFLEGYRERRHLGSEWLAAFPDMLALQRSMNYALFHQYRDPNNITDKDRDSWRRFRRDIEAATPVLDLDFSAF
jgi:Ser/Thr protein kinase RdoA (MazF antagonist)